MRRIALVVVSLLVGASGVAGADVSPTNGNFSITYTDMIYGGGLGLAMERTYNSRSADYSGMFGPGWGLYWETYLVPMPDRSVVMFEHGGGADNRFEPSDYGRAEVQHMVDTIVDAAKRAGELKSRRAELDYRTALAADLPLRTSEWRRLTLRGVARVETLVGTTLLSREQSKQKIVRIAKGWERHRDVGVVDRFDDRGRLLQTTDPNGNWIRLTYDRKNRITRIVDNLKRSLTFKYTRAGKLRELRGLGGDVARYKDDKHGRLVYSVDVAKNTYRYRYDDGNRMTRVEYVDGTSMRIGYYDQDRLHNARVVEYPSGRVIIYTYKDEMQKQQRAAGIEEFPGRDKPPDQLVLRTLFFKRDLVLGEDILVEERQELQGRQNGVVLSKYDRARRVVRKQVGKDYLAYTYDKDGRIVEQKNDKFDMKISYHPVNGRRARVVEEDLENKTKQWVAFDYDKRGNLIRARTSKSAKPIVLKRDARGLVSEVENGPDVLRFTYDRVGRITALELVGVGHVVVPYDATGQRGTITSPGGQAIYDKVNEAQIKVREITRLANEHLGL